MSASRKGSTGHRHGYRLPARSTELLIVVAVVLVLLLIAVPSYLGYVSSAHSASAKANLASAIPAVEAYFLLTDNTYAGLDLRWLETYAPGVKVDDPGANPTKQTATSYCVSATVGGKTWYKAGPAAQLSTVPC